MRYIVEGADSQTGKDRVEVVSADSKDAAAKIAKDKGMFVSSVKEGANPVPVKTAKASTKASGGVPTYIGLVVAKTIIAVYAGILYVIAIVAFVAGLWAFARTPGASDYGIRPDPVLVFAPSIALFVAGGLMHGLSAGLSALRDIAINSFKT